MFKKKNSLNLLGLLTFIILIACSWSLFFKGLGYGHDLNHRARIFEMAQGLKDGHFPVIWSQNLAYGYGMPLFEFYAPLPYYLGAFFHLLGFNLSISIKLLIFLNNIITFTTAFLFAKKLFKNKKAALLVAAGICLAPYRAVDLIRTAHSESWAISFLPLVLVGIIKIIEQEKWGWLIMSFSFAAVLLSHNITALISLPFLIAFSFIYLFFITKQKNKKIVILNQLILSGVLSLAIAAFYFIPALLEKNLTRIDSFILDPYYDIGQHFLYIRQFIKPWGAWEYGASVWGPNDKMSFFLGFAQWLVFFVVGWQILWQFKRKRKDKNYRLQIVFLFLTVTSLFLTLLKTQEIWRLIELSRYVQFPWRLLSLSLIFGASLMGSSYLLIKKKWQNIYFYLILALLIGFNARYFRNEKYIDRSVEYQDYRQVILNKNSSYLYDYLPKDFDFLEKNGFEIYKKPSVVEVEIPSQSVLPKELTPFVTNLDEKVNRKKFTIDLENNGVKTFNLAYYPGWTASINGHETELKANEDGLVSFNLEEGKNNVVLELKDTLVRRWSKIVSGLAFVFSLVLIFLNLKKNKI